MFGCVLNKTKMTVLVIVFGAALISVAIAVGLSVGLSRNKIKSHATTGGYLLKTFQQDNRSVQSYEH